MDFVNQVQILDKAIFISGCTNVFEKRMNPVMNEVQRQTWLISFGTATSLGEENLNQMLL